MDEPRWRSAHQRLRHEPSIGFHVQTACDWNMQQRSEDLEARLRQRSEDLDARARKDSLAQLTPNTCSFLWPKG